jgi:hypothetical protein
MATPTGPTGTTTEAGRLEPQALVFKVPLPPADIRSGGAHPCPHNHPSGV